MRVNTVGSGGCMKYERLIGVPFMAMVLLDSFQYLKFGPAAAMIDYCDAFD